MAKTKHVADTESPAAVEDYEQATAEHMVGVHGAETVAAVFSAAAAEGVRGPNDLHGLWHEVMRWDGPHDLQDRATRLPPVVQEPR